MLIYFIHHIAKSIQLPEVIAGIADDLMKSIDAEFPDKVGDGADAEPVSQKHAGKSVPELLTLIEERGAEVPSQVSGYIQYVGLLPADRHRHPDRLGDPAGAPARPLSRHRPRRWPWSGRGERRPRSPAPSPRRT